MDEQTTETLTHCTRRRRTRSRSRNTHLPVLLPTISGFHTRPPDFRPSWNAVWVFMVIGLQQPRLARTTTAEEWKDVRVNKCAMAEGGASSGRQHSLVLSTPLLYSLPSSVAMIFSRAIVLVALPLLAVATSRMHKVRAPAASCCEGLYPVRSCLPIT